MDFLINYSLYAAKLVTFVIIVLAFIGGLAVMITKSKEPSSPKIKIKKLNEYYHDLKENIQAHVLSKQQLKQNYKAQKKLNKEQAKLAESTPRLFVINFDGDIKASAAQALSELITAVLLIAQANDEVLLRLESSGGLVNAYGLASTQLQRLREAKIKLTVAVDKMAASGGYMMASVANKILAAPFAIIGSIGVIAQLPNFHRFLEKKNIDFEQITAGEYKRTLTLFGENTDKGRQKLQEEVEDTQELFKNFIKAHRPQVDVNKVATGEHWFGKRAIELALVDELKTSDDYLLAAKDSMAIYELTYKVKTPLATRLGLGIESLLSKCFAGNLQQAGRDYL